MKRVQRVRGWIVRSLLLPVACATLLFVSGCDGEADIGLEASGEPVKIAIIGADDFIPDQTGIRARGLPDVLVARISERLTNSRRFTILERTALRRVILEGRFVDKLPESNVDRVLEKAVVDLENINAATLTTAGQLARNSDVLKGFQDLGNTAGADFLVYAKLEKLERSSVKTAVPYSDSGNAMTRKGIDSRLYLRVVNVKSGSVAGAASLRVHISESAFSGAEPRQDDYSIFDEVGRQAASKIIDMVFPARIVGSDPWVINRGTNDGVRKNDVYDVLREGKVIKDVSGLVLGKVKSQVGKIKLDQVQGTLTVVTVVEGDIADNDLVELTASARASPRVASSAKVTLTRGSVTTGNLPRVAIGLVKTGSTARTGKSADEHIGTFTDTIISRLTQTKRFQLIDRQEVDQLLNEQVAQAMAENRPLPTAMGTLEGADYLVYGSIASFNVEDRTANLPGSSKIIKSKMGYVEGNVRIVDARSGDILESRKISVTEKLDARSKRKRLAALLADAYADQVVLNLMSAIYPIKVAAVTADGTVYINRGNDGGLFVGEKLQAYRPGAPVVDPDTGVQLGVTETALGEVVIADVEDARSKGHASGQLQTGDLLKRSSQHKYSRTTVAAKSQQGERSGSDLSSVKSKGKATLAVGKIALNKRGKNSMLSSASINRVTEDLIVKLSQTRRFEVMERQQVDQLLNEKEFTATAQGGDVTESLQQLVGADYLIYGSVDDFYVNSSRQNIATLDEVQVTNTGVVEASLRIVDVHTGKVVAADKIRINLKLASSKDRRKVVNDLIEDFTAKMVSSIVARLYPIKVLGLAGDGVLYINSGESSGLRQGDQYTVMRAGDTLVDEDTGVEFGAMEIQIAKVELTTIEAGRSTAKVISGGEVMKGDILRSASSARARATTQKVRRIQKPSF